MRYFSRFSPGLSVCVTFLQEEDPSGSRGKERLLFSIDSHGWLWKEDREERGEEKHAVAAVCGGKERVGKSQRGVGACCSWSQAVGLQ